MKYMVFIIQNFANKSPEGSLADNTTLEIIDTDIESALKRAKQIMGKQGKKYFRVQSVIENFKK